MRFVSGTRLGPYEIIAPLGAGGMGEVYRARDTRLGRDVAVKVLPQHLIENSDVRARFEREARTVSSLNHPHICTLHDVGREGDIDYLVMEMIDGETLSTRLERGPLATTELLRIATQIADALDRAHRAGIIHRDLKPGNVMITKSGAKLMDFGLARQAVPGAAGAGSASGAGITVAALTQSPTMASPLTVQGTLVGTFLYMAPEQLEGKDADARTDLWSFGCMLYEMATGRRAFEGKSQASLIGAIMHSEPAPLATLAPAAPPALEPIIRACLAKDPDERIQTAHDVKLQLSWIGQATTQSAIVAPPPLPRRGAAREPIAWAIAGLAIGAAAFLAWRGMAGGSSATGAQVRFTIPIPAGISFADMPRISPDGKLLAFSAQDSSNHSMVWVRPLNSLWANPLPGTEGAGRPFWSPDSRFLGFIAEGKLKKVLVSGGPPQVICDAASGADGTWSSKGDILFDGRLGADVLRRVNAAGGVASVAVKPDSGSGVGWPDFLPDGKHFLYASIGNAGGFAVMVGTLGSAKGVALGITGSRVEYSPDGYLLFVRDRSLLAQRFDAGSLKLSGEPFPVAEDLPVAGNGQANFSVSDNGVLVYRPTALSLSRLVWLDRAGRITSEIAGAGDYRAPALSPDGSRIAVRRREQSANDTDIWVIEPARGTTTRFTFNSEFDGNPLWSPEGSTIAWIGTRNGTDNLLTKSASGLGQDQLIAPTGTNSAATDWSRDGRYVLIHALGGRTASDIYAVPMTGTNHKPQVVLQTPYNEGRAVFSPDGRWIAYQSNESGRNEIYVASFQGSAGKWQISTRGGTDPCWSRDGRELFYLTLDQALMSMPVTSTATFQPGTPQELFRVRTETGGRRNVFCPAPDGKRFLFQLPLGDTNTPMTMVLNWRVGMDRK